jgi:TetR/AcrR family transcriptional regulator
VNYLHSNFEKLAEEKKKKIIDAAIREFSKDGYINASTNNIVKEAGIAKGALFNYFGNKKNLYLYILDYMIDHYVNYMVEKINVNNPDIFQRILEWTELKISISNEEPMTYKFFASAFLNVPEEIKGEVEIRYKKLYDKGYRLAIDDIDMSKFRNDIDKQKAIELIIAALNGISEKYMMMYKSLDDNGYERRNQSLEELKEYIAVLKKVFYYDMME